MTLFQLSSKLDKLSNNLCKMSTSEEQKSQMTSSIVGDNFMLMMQTALRIIYSLKTHALQNPQISSRCPILIFPILQNSKLPSHCACLIQFSAYQFSYQHMVQLLQGTGRVDMFLGNIKNISIKYILTKIFVDLTENK